MKRGNDEYLTHANELVRDYPACDGSIVSVFFTLALATDWSERLVISNIKFHFTCSERNRSLDFSPMAIPPALRAQRR
jgi:hypothetical protein